MSMRLVRGAGLLVGAVLLVGLNLGTSGPAPGAAAGSGAVAAQPLPRLVIGHSNVAPTYGPLWLAAEAGIFRRYGLDAEVRSLGPGATTVSVLRGGDVQVLFTGGPGAVAGALEDPNVVIFGGYLDRMPFHVVARPGVASVAALRGQAVAVNAFGGASDWVMRYVLAQAGLAPERDVELRALGTDTQRLAALRDGTIAGTLLATPYHVVAQREGMRALVNTATLPLRYSQSVLVAMRPYLAANPSAVRAVLQATAEAVQLYKQDEALATRVLADRLGIDDPELVAATWAFYRDAFSDDLEPRGLEIILEEALRNQPARAGTSLADLVDFRYLQPAAGKGS
jgi:ABC-type nitrate/sulfonate/bicarbonate transport system substrate-binding protein